MTCGTSAARPQQSVRDPVCTFLVIVRAVSSKERVRTPRPAGGGKIKIDPPQTGAKMVLKKSFRHRKSAAVKRLETAVKSYKVNPRA